MTALLVFFAVLALFGLAFYFAWRASRNAKRDAQDEVTLDRMRADVHSDGIDEESPVVKDIVQAARDEGAV